MNDQQIRANVNVLGPARLAAQLLDFGESCIVALEAYFLAVMGWAYWADYPTVSSYDISGLNETPTPGSIGAGIAALCWSILSNSQTFATLVNAGRADDLTGAIAALCAWRPDLTDEINANVAILAPIATIPEPVVVPASSISAADDTTASVVDAPTPTPSPVEEVSTVALDAPDLAAPATVDAPPEVVDAPPEVVDAPPEVVDDRPHSIAQYGDSFWSLGLRVGISAEAVKRCNPGMTSVTPGSVVYLA
jgi:LysM repeat protein